MNATAPTATTPPADPQTGEVIEETTAVTTAEKKPLTPAEGFKLTLANKYMASIENAFGNHTEAMKFLSAVSNAVQKTPKLLDCTETSLMNAVMSCVACKIYPNTPSGEAYLIPYGKEVQFQLGYQGIVTLLYRSSIDMIYSEIVRENDEFDFEMGLNPRLVHKPNLDSERGEAKAVYVVAVHKGEKAYYVMSKYEVEKFKKFSKSASSSSSPWKESNDPQLNMWRKTALKQLAKLLPTNSEIAEAIEADTKADLAPQKSNIRKATVTTDLDA